MNAQYPHDLLARLQAAETAEERGWLVTKALLDSLPPDLQQAAWAAAVPHWFDAEILAALLERPVADCAALYTELQTLPFVEPFEARGGYNVHEVTRAAMLDHLWRERREEYVTLSTRAADYFAGRDRPEWQIERVYHLLLTDPDLGANRLWHLDAEWNNSFEFSLEYALSQTAVEQAESNRIEGRARGWAYYCQGDMERRYYHNEEAKSALLLALESVDGDRQLEANCIKALGDVHLQLAEYGEARARYEEARPIYAAIGDRLGEANCIQALGDVHLQLAEYGEARARYEEARPIYAAIGDRLGEANCIKALGDVHKQLAEYGEARARYEEARPIYAAIGARLGEANCIQALGDVHTDQEDYEKGLEMLEEAASRYRALGITSAEAGAINSIAGLHDARGEYRKAVEAYTRALEIHVNPMWYRNRAHQYIKLRDAERATQDIEEADRLQPDHPYLHLRRGDLAMLRKDYASAEANYRTALDRHPRLNLAHFGLGQALLCLNRTDEALAAYRTGLKHTYAAGDLKEPLKDLEALSAEQPDLPGLAEALALLRDAQESKAK